jgi:Holliday junction resolvase-like predicted endonuclease
MVTFPSPKRCDRRALAKSQTASLPAVTFARLRLGRRAEQLIALDGRTLVFVEVKAGRTGATLGPERPAHAVGRRKQVKLRRLAREWIAERRGPSGVSGYRFDVVGVCFGEDGLANIDHIRAAF